VRLCASGQRGAALVPLQRAIDFGDFYSLSLMAVLLINGREGVAKDEERGFQLLEEGARLGSEFSRLMLKFVLALRKLQTCLKHYLDSSLSPDPQQMALLLQYRQLLLEFQTAWKRRGGASLPPPQEIPWHCLVSLSVTRAVIVLLQTWPKPFAGTGTPKQWVTLQLQPSCRGWVRELFQQQLSPPPPPCNKILSRVTCDA